MGKVLVVGATGFLGGMIARKLAAQGHEVRAMVRPTADAAPLRAVGAEIVAGDLKQPATLAPAVAGVDAVVTTANTAARGGDDTVERVDLEGTAALVEAAARAGVRQLVYLSAYGTRLDHPAPFVQAKARSEVAIKASGIPSYAILRPDMFAEIWAGVLVGGPVARGKPVTFLGNGKVRHSFVSVPDVATVAAACVLNPQADRVTFDVGGPETLSWEDVVGVFEKVLGRTIAVENLPRDQDIPDAPPVFSQFIRYLETDTSIDMRRVSDRLGVRLTPFEDTVRAMLAPA